MDEMQGEEAAQPQGASRVATRLPVGRRWRQEQVQGAGVAELVRL